MGGQGGKAQWPRQQRQQCTFIPLPGVDNISLLSGSVDSDKNGNDNKEEVALDVIAVEVGGHDTNVDIATTGGNDGCNNTDLDDNTDNDGSLFGSSVDGDKNGNDDNEEVVLDATAVEVEGHGLNVDIATEVVGNNGRNNYGLEDDGNDDRGANLPCFYVGLNINIYMLPIPPFSPPLSLSPIIDNPSCVTSSVDCCV